MLHYNGGIDWAGVLTGQRVVKTGINAETDSKLQNYASARPTEPTAGLALHIARHG